MMTGNHELFIGAGAGESSRIKLSLCRTDFYIGFLKNGNINQQDLGA